MNTLQLQSGSLTPVGRVFANDPGDLDSVPGHVIPNTFKMVLDISLLNTQQCNARNKGKVEQCRESSSTLSYNPVAIEKRTSRSPSTTVAIFTLLTSFALIPFRTTAASSVLTQQYFQYGPFQSPMCQNQSLFFLPHYWIFFSYRQNDATYQIGV